MKPARSAHETATLPTLAHSARVVSVTSSSVETVETTSTSFMIGAGLKKCMPTTSCGRLVAWAHAMIGSDEVVVARIAPGLQISSRFSKSVVLIARSSAIASTTMSTSLRSSSEVEPVTRASTSALASSVALPRWICLSKFLVMAADDAVDLVLAAADDEHVVAALGEDLDDAAGHGAGADDADQLDVVLELRLLVGRRASCRRRRRRGCRRPRRCRSRGRSSGPAGRRSPSA